MKIKRQKLQIAFLAFVILALFLYSACDDPETEEKKEVKAKETKSLLRFVPEGKYFSLGFIDLDELVENDQIQQMLELAPALELFNEKLGVDIEKFHKLTMALEFPNIYEHNSNGLIVVSTDLDEEDLLEMIGEKARFFEKKKIGSYKLYYSGPELSFSFVEDGTLIMGSSSMVKKSLEVANGKSKSVLEGDNLEYFKEYLGNEDSIWIGLTGINEIFHELARENVMFKNYTTIEFAYFGIDTSDDFGVRLIAQCSKEKYARKLAGGLRSLIGIFSSFIDLKGLNIEDSDAEEIDIERLKEMVERIVDSIDINNEGKNVIISIQVPKGMVDLFLDMARSTLQDANSGILPDDLNEDQTSSISVTVR
jgi:hypothetical protein